MTTANFPPNSASDSTFDVSAHVRSQFPALEHSELALFDNAGGTVPCRQSVRATTRYLTECPVQLGADYPMSHEAGGRLEAAHAAGLSLLETETSRLTGEQLVFGGSATALFGYLAKALEPRFVHGDEIIVTSFDHEANIGAWRRLEARGISIREWQPDPGSLTTSIAGLHRLLSPRTKLVAFTHCSNIFGEALPIAEICATVRAAGALSVVDGVAFAPHRPLSVDQWGCDFYVFSLYKVFGPHCAVLYGRRDALSSVANLNHFFHAKSAPALRLQPGAFAYELAAATTGVAAYFDELATSLGASARAAAWDAIEHHERALTEHVLAALRAHPSVRVIGPEESGFTRLPIISFQVPGRSSKDLAAAFVEHGIELRYGDFYAPRLIKALGLTATDGVVRLSLAHYNSMAEVAAFVRALESILGPV